MELGSGGGGCGTLRRRPPESSHQPLTTLDYADNAVEEVTVSSEQAHLLQHHHHQEQQSRHRHLDILEEVGKHERQYEHVVTLEPDSIRQISSVFRPSRRRLSFRQSPGDIEPRKDLLFDDRSAQIYVHVHVLRTKRLLSGGYRVI